MMPSFDDNDAVASPEAKPSEPKPSIVEEEPPKLHSIEPESNEHEPESKLQKRPPPSAATSTTSSDNGEDGSGLWGLTSAFGGASGWGLGSGGVTETETTTYASSPAAITGDENQRQTGATDAELAELENSIAAAETAVSTAIWSTFAAVSTAVGGATTTAAEGNPTKKDSNAPLTDEDLDDILTGGSESPKGSDEAAKPETPEAPATATSNPNTTSTTATAKDSQAATPSSIPESTASTSTSIWSSLGAAVSETLVGATASTTAEGEDEEGQKEDGGDDSNPAAASSSVAATASSTLYNLYTSNVNRAAEWIEDLERAQSDNDPYKRLKDHLNTYLTAHPRGNYEEWVEIYLGEHGWDASDHNAAAPAVVDSSYYTEECPHRILWNEKCYQDGIQINDENPSRAYVPTPSTNEERRHRKPVDADDEEIITFDAANDNDDDNKSNSTPNNANDDDGLPDGTQATPASPPTEQQQQPLFKDDASMVVVQKPSPVLSCSTLDTRSDDGSGILVSKTASTMLKMPQD